MDKNSIRRVEKLVGIGMYFSLVVGFAAILMSLISFLSGEYTAAGLSLIAGALSFGLLSFAILRD